MKSRIVVLLANITVKISITSIKSLFWVTFEYCMTLSISIKVGLHSTKDAMKLMNAACFVLKVASDIGNVTTNLIINDTFVDLSFEVTTVLELIAGAFSVVTDILVIGRWTYELLLVLELVLVLPVLARVIVVGDALADDDTTPKLSPLAAADELLFWAAFDVVSPFQPAVCPAIGIPAELAGDE
jgi:hypothetical protein